MDREKMVAALKAAIASCYEVPDGSKNSLADCRAKPFDRWLSAQKPIVASQNQVYKFRDTRYLVLAANSVPLTDEREWTGFLAENGRGFVYEFKLEFRAPVWTVPVFKSRNISDLTDEELWWLYSGLSELMGDYDATRLAEHVKTSRDRNEFHNAVMKAVYAKA